MASIRGTFSRVIAPTVVMAALLLAPVFAEKIMGQKATEHTPSAMPKTTAIAETTVKLCASAKNQDEVSSIEAAIQSEKEKSFVLYVRKGQVDTQKTLDEFLQKVTAYAVREGVSMEVCYGPPPSIRGGTVFAIIVGGDMRGPYTGETLRAGMTRALVEYRLKFPDKVSTPTTGAETSSSPKVPTRKPESGATQKKQPD